MTFSKCESLFKKDWSAQKSEVISHDFSFSLASNDDEIAGSGKLQDHCLSWF